MVPYNKCLTDSKELIRIRSAIKQKIVEINNKHTRCHNIEISGWNKYTATETVFVDGNFVLSIREVKSTMLSEPVT